MPKVILISFFGIISSTFLSLWNLFLHWLSIFAAPVKEPEMFWIIIPIWINWFFAEFFQEKHGTSFGNAVSNGAIAMLASIDWTRYLYRLLVDGTVIFTFGIVIKFAISLGVFAYGIYVIIQGSRSKKIVYSIGRIRWITYVLVIITPIIYNVIKFDFQTLLSAILFFPLYYWIIEVLDRVAPEPQYYQAGKS